MYQFNLTDTANNTKITGTKSFDEMEAYFEKRGLGKNGGVINYQANGHVSVSANDLKGHKIVGTVTKIK